VVTWGHHQAKPAMRGTCGGKGGAYLGVAGDVVLRVAARADGKQASKRVGGSVDTRRHHSYPLPSSLSPTHSPSSAQKNAN